MREESIAIVAGIVVLFIYFAIIGISIADYIITSLSLHAIAKRRQISNPWMAWIPFLGNWIIGDIVDSYEMAKGIKRRWRVVLLTLNLLSFVSFIFIYIYSFASVLATELSYSVDPQTEEILRIVIPIYILMIVAVISAQIFSFCKIICIYKIYENANPPKAVKYIILTLAVPLAGAICLMKCKDRVYSPVQPVFIAQPVPEADVVYQPEQHIDDNASSEEN